ncbi:MAG: adenylyl-sulfate kinase [Candidatus Cloacimonetes bacterium 4572_55]|nr:MAG: adenylyl-sulfate kinase [Candidatus Cloacimonetes bacterium 4572_55]
MSTHHIIQSHYKTTTQARSIRNGHKPAVIWLTGLSGSGKSTVADALDVELFRLGYQSFALDGDNVRHGLNSDLGFDPADRKENIRRVAEVARLFSDVGFIVIVAFISPYLDDRRNAKAVIGSDRFIECFVKASLKVCETRDPKGLYKKARQGKIPSFTGVSAPYQEPVAPDVTLDTDHDNVPACVRRVLDYLISRQIIPNDSHVDL